MNAQKKFLITLLVAGMFMLTMISLSGCKKKEETTNTVETTDTEQVVAAVTEEIEQTSCPIMDGPINKNLFTEYKGKKVYFCCPGCKEKFEEAPEKYLPKLPQFKI